jgi:hypothetical protein
MLKSGVNREKIGKMQTVQNCHFTRTYDGSQYAFTQLVQIPLSALTILTYDYLFPN